MTRQELAAAIYKASHVEGQFRLRSGITSHQYFDQYQFESDPHLLRAVGEALIALIPPETEVFAGLELGGVPIATVLGQLTGLSVVFVRRTAKEYGTCRLAEGGPISGRRLLIVEDVVTSGGQIIESARALRALGGRVEAALCVIDRESGGLDALAADGIDLRSLFRMTELNARNEETRSRR